MIRTRGPSQQELQASPRLRASSSNSSLTAAVDGAARPGEASAAAAAAAFIPADVLAETRVGSLADLRDYNQPRAEGSLVKCALLVLGVVGAPPTDAAAAATPVASTPTPTLESYLLAAGVPAGATLEVETWSLLPHGSGLGTSSILAGTVCAAIAGALGCAYDPPSLVHLVLQLEQLLSTGGGWQDQVGGLCAGVKAAVSEPALPLRVRVVPVETAGAPSGAPSFLDDRLFLIYTGKTRLAKDLLQRVLRQWALRDNGVTSLVAGLRTNAVKMAAAVQRGDALAVGSYLDTYYAQKKEMAPGSEPIAVTDLLRVLRGSGAILGASLTGAGGGGFLVCVASEPGGNNVAAIERVLRAHPATVVMDVSVHAAAIDRAGLCVTVQQ